jgi:hypothetical protein
MLESGLTRLIADCSKASFLVAHSFHVQTDQKYVIFIEFSVYIAIPWCLVWIDLQ